MSADDPIVKARVPIRSPRRPMGSETRSVAIPADASTAPVSTLVSDSFSAYVGAMGTIAIQTTSVRKISA